VSGGFATVQPGSQLSINAVEGYALEDFSADAVRNQISEAQKIAGGSGSETDIAEAKIELEVSGYAFVHFTLEYWADEMKRNTAEIANIVCTGPRESAGGSEIK